MFYIDNSIYDSTLLEGLPFTLKYCESRPKYVYNVNSGRPILSNFRDWHNIKENPPLYRIRNLFLHDTSHAILYFIRNETHRLFKNDFGLSWDKVKTINNNQFYFSNKKERMDEYKISAIHDILFFNLMKKGLPTVKGQVKILHKDTHNIWHTSDKITPTIKKEKHEELCNAVDYVYNEIGPSAVRDAARSLIVYLKENLG